MYTLEKARVVTARCIAGLLVIGGVFGVGISIVLGAQLAQRHWAYAVMSAALAAVFRYCVMTGIRLWRDEPRGRKWATILMALQIPVLTLPGLSYEFYTGLALKLMGGAGVEPFAVELGSSFLLTVGSETTESACGINVLALVSLFALLAMRSDPPVRGTSD